MSRESGRRRRQKKLPVNRRSVGAAAIGALGFPAFAGILQASLRASAFSRGLVMASMAVLITELAALVCGARQYRKTEYSPAGRRAGLWLPLAAVVLWGGIYLAGFFL